MLLEQRIVDLQKDKGALIDKVRELKKENASLKAIRKYELNVAKLEIEKLEQRNAELEKEKCELLGIIQGKDKVIQELEKENEQLKAQIEEEKKFRKDVMNNELRLIKQIEKMKVVSTVSLRLRNGGRNMKNIWRKEIL